MMDDTGTQDFNAPDASGVDAPIVENPPTVDEKISLMGSILEAQASTILNQQLQIEELKTKVFRIIDKIGMN